MRLGRRALLAAPLVMAAGKVPLAATPLSRMDTPWWRERHLAKLAELKRGPVDLVFLGDSITQNWERAGPEPWANFAPVWQRLYGPRHAVNLGFKGDATSHLLWRMKNGELDGISPKAAVILIGANNLGRLHWPAADTIAGIGAVVTEARLRLPRTRLLLLGVLPSERSPWATATTLEINRGLAAAYGSGGTAGLVYRDVSAVFMKNGAFDRTQFYDPLLKPPEPPLHPTAQAQERMALAIEAMLGVMMVG